MRPGWYHIAERGELRRRAEQPELSDAGLLRQAAAMARQAERNRARAARKAAVIAEIRRQDRRSGL